MKVAVEGCCHGELDKIYETLTHLEKTNDVKIDLLLICGDFQSVRNASDLSSMATPPKYRRMNSFYKYYSGEKLAPVLTVFIGGNHEASNYLQELPYGGWVAPNIYYMGYANVIRYGGLRIGGLSGIYKPRDFDRGHFEHPPYSDDTMRSAYHIRSIDVFRLKQISRPVDIMLSHDWPLGIYNHGNKARLLSKKKHFRAEVESNTLGSLPAQQLLYHIKPDYWFSAHLHVKFAATVEHTLSDGQAKRTKFLALDKCLPKRQFLQVLDIPHDVSRDLTLELDPEWLVILKSTNHLLHLKSTKRYMPGLGSSERWDFTVTDDDIKSIEDDFDGNLQIPENFMQGVPPYESGRRTDNAAAPILVTNPQTTLLCTMLDITDPNAEFLGQNSSFNVDQGSFNDSMVSDSEDGGILSRSSVADTTRSSSFNTSFNPDEIDIDDESYSDDSIDDDEAGNDTKSVPSDTPGAITELVTDVTSDKRDKDEVTQAVRGSEAINMIDDDDTELNEILKAQKDVHSTEHTNTCTVTAAVERSESPSKFSHPCNKTSDRPQYSSKRTTRICDRIRSSVKGNKTSESATYPTDYTTSEYKDAELCTEQTHIIDLNKEVLSVDPASKNNKNTTSGDVDCHLLSPKRDHTPETTEPHLATKRLKRRNQSMYSLDETESETS